jgi:hypothetical protein
MEEVPAFGGRGTPPGLLLLYAIGPALVHGPSSDVA